MREFQTTLLQGEDADSDSDEVSTDLSLVLAGDHNICRLAIADKNFGADDKAHTVEERKHSPHGTYELQAERGLVLYDVNLEHRSMAFKKDSFSPQLYTSVSGDNSLESHCKAQSLPLTPNHHRTTTAKQPRLKKISSTGSLLSLHSSATISYIDSYIRVNNTRKLKESAAESSHNKVKKMIHLGEALGLGNSALLEKNFGLIIRQLEKEREDWQKQ
ncbi:hypothetical protein POTOM_015459 [Populus tomentosa]|uniref:Uncharacterized protein n=1 Tax=Populus tomentosa TaxID=118781 RepID=A0A8X8D652_POPTO|nr:hypothetical protein POTOM_015459 [Populus tomentosa]